MYFKVNKNRHTDQWNRMVSPQINPHICNQMILIFNKSTMTIQWEKEQSFQQMGWENGIPTCQ